MKLIPVPFPTKGRIVTDAQLTRPTSRDLANVQKATKSGNPYSAIIILISAGVSSYQLADGSEITGRAEVADASRDMPFQDANVVSMQVFLNLGADKMVDGYFQCPRCQNVLEDDEPDDISELPVVEYIREDGSKEFSPRPIFSLSYPIEFRSAKDQEVVEEVRSIRLHYPTLTECAAACRKTGMEDEASLQLAIYAEATEEVNGSPIDDKYRGEWLGQAFDRLDPQDLRGIGKALNEYGMKAILNKRCPKCGKVFEAGVNTADFFSSALRGES